MAATRELRAEQRQELARYQADFLASRAPLGASLAAGAVAGLGVYLVPVGVVLGSFVLLRLAYAVVVPPSRWLFRLFGWGVYRTGGTLAVPAAPTPTAAPAPPAPAGLESALDAPVAGEWVVAAALVGFWPLAMLLIGAIAAAVYRARRARRSDDLAHHPLDFAILGEVVLFYALTAGAGVLVGVGTFVALGANVIFAWAGYLIWRWLHDHLLWRLAPAHLRAETAARAAGEGAYRRRLLEAG